MIAAHFAVSPVRGGRPEHPDVATALRPQRSQTGGVLPDERLESRCGPGTLQLQSVSRARAAVQRRRRLHIRRAEQGQRLRWDVPRLSPGGGGRDPR